MIVKDLIRNWNTLQGEFRKNEKGWNKYEELDGWTSLRQWSPQYVIMNSVKIRLFVEFYKPSDSQKAIQFLCVVYNYLRPDDDLKYCIHFTSKKLAECHTIKWTNNLVYRQLSKTTTDAYSSFDVKIEVEIEPPKTNPFSCLHEDTELIDFELRGEDGSVSMHKVVLASSSPVLRRMLSGKWKETAKGVVEVPGISLSTLQLFKDFIYLGTLPSTGLEQLLLLAMYYMIPKLEHICACKLVDSMTTQNTCEILEFAVKHKASKLILAMLQSVQDGNVKVSDITTITDKK